MGISSYSVCLIYPLYGNFLHGELVSMMFCQNGIHHVLMAAENW